MRIKSLVLRGIAVAIIAISLSSCEGNNSGPAETTIKDIKEDPATKKAAAADSVQIKKKLARAQKLLKNFQLIKNDDGTYWYRHQNWGPSMQNMEQISLVAFVNKDGDIYMRSLYFGKTISHTKVSVQIGDQKKETEEVGLDDHDNKEGTVTLGIGSEKVIFANGKDNGILKAIADAKPEDKITVQLIGRKDQTVFELPAKTQKGIKDCVELASLLKATKKPVDK